MQWHTAFAGLMFLHSAPPPRTGWHWHRDAVALAAALLAALALVVAAPALRAGGCRVGRDGRWRSVARFESAERKEEPRGDEDDEADARAEHEDAGR